MNYFSLRNGTNYFNLRENPYLKAVPQRKDIFQSEGESVLEGCSPEKG